MSFHTFNQTQDLTDFKAIYDDDDDVMCMDSEAVTTLLSILV